MMVTFCTTIFHPVIDGIFLISAMLILIEISCFTFVTIVDIIFSDGFTFVTVGYFQICANAYEMQVYFYTCNITNFVKIVILYLFNIVIDFLQYFIK